MTTKPPYVPLLGESPRITQSALQLLQQEEKRQRGEPADDEHTGHLSGDSNTKDDMPPLDQDVGSEKATTATDGSAEPTPFPNCPPHKKIDDVRELAEYLAASSYIISLGGAPLPGLKYGIIVVPAGDESLLFSGYGEQAALFPDIAEAVYAKSRMVDEQERKELLDRARAAQATAKVEEGIIELPVAEKSTPPTTADKLTDLGYQFIRIGGFVMVVDPEGRCSELPKGEEKEPFLQRHLASFSQVEQGHPDRRRTDAVSSRVNGSGTALAHGDATAQTPEAVTAGEAPKESSLKDAPTHAVRPEQQLSDTVASAVPPEQQQSDNPTAAAPTGVEPAFVELTVFPSACSSLSTPLDSQDDDRPVVQEVARLQPLVTVRPSSVRISISSSRASAETATVFESERPSSQPPQPPSPASASAPASGTASSPTGTNPSPQPQAQTQTQAQSQPQPTPSPQPATLQKPPRLTPKARSLLENLLSGGAGTDSRTQPGTRTRHRGIRKTLKSWIHKSKIPPPQGHHQEGSAAADNNPAAIGRGVLLEVAAAITDLAAGGERAENPGVDEGVWGRVRKGFVAEG